MTTTGAVIVGIDPSTTALAITIGNADGTGSLVEKFRIRGTERHKQCQSAYDIVTTLLANTSNVALVVLEAPVLGRGGPGSTIPQAMVSGAVQAAVAATGLPFELANNTSWKKSVVGKGTADKLAITKWVAENVEDAYIQCRTTTGLVDQDKCDSVCIYLYGVNLNTIRRKVQRRLKKMTPVA